MKKQTRNRVAIFGGSFNPPTKGHVKVAEMVLKANLTDKVWFMPCFNHNFGKLTADPLDRVEMLYRAIHGKKNMEVCLYEIVTESDGKLFNTMEHLVRNNPNTDFSVIIGMDCAFDIKRWYNWEELINLVPFIVVNRFGYDRLEAKIITHWYENEPHIILDVPTKKECSSTIARKAIEKNDNETKDRILYRNVLSYIETRGLYK